MSMNDTLANALSSILNCERIGKTECKINNVSKVIKNALEILQKHGYVG
ncbi:30S ribosomal protein S8, partial [archaeon]|nr:30S ribosomal protein S8 [archaeon]